MTVLTDKLVMSNLAQEETEFNQLFFEQYDNIYGLLFRLLGTRAEAEDIAQEVFLKLYRNPPTQANSNIGAWLYRVATNAGYNALRTRKQQWQRHQRLLREPQELGESPDQQVVAMQEMDSVREALALLPQEQSQLLLLRQMGLSYRELAEICKLNPNSVGQLLARAAKAFKAAYIRVTPEKHHA